MSKHSPYYYAGRAVAGAAQGAVIRLGKQYLYRKGQDLVNQQIRSYTKGQQPYRYKRRKYKKRRNVQKQIKTMKKQIKSVKRIAESDMGTHLSRFRNTGSVLSTVNLMTQTAISAVTVTTLETVIGELLYYDIKIPGTLLNVSGTTGTFQKEFYFDKVYSIMKVRNNYQVPCSCTIYLVQPKEDTSISPTTAFTNGLIDQGNPTFNSPLVFITDSIQFKDLWKITKSARYVLQPGDVASLTYNGKKFQYDPSLVDSHALTFQNRFGGAVFIIRVDGPLGHDTVADEQGQMLAGLDYQMDRTFIVKYSAGADIHNINVTDSSDSFTNGGVCSNMPLADNQAYSLA